VGIWRSRNGNRQAVAIPKEEYRLVQWFPKFPGDPRKGICNSYFEVECFVKNNRETSLIGDVYFVLLLEYVVKRRAG
jgi:hypothetical protein